MSTGINLSFSDDGSGSPLLLIHGFPHNRTLWSEQVAAFSLEFRCITPDLRGFGESEQRPPYSVEQYADDLAALLAHLGVGRAIVGGLSMGGYTALAMWRRHASLIAALMLFDTRAEADTPEGREKRGELIAVARQRGSRAVADSQIEGQLGRTTRAESPSTVRRIHEMLASAPVEGVVGALGAMRDRPDSIPLLATIDVPTLIVVGDEDVLTPVKDSQRMHDGIRGSALDVIERAGHLSNVERPTEFNRAMREFLSPLKDRV